MVDDANRFLGRRSSREAPVLANLFIRHSEMAVRDAHMVTGFDLIGQNRTFQIHWAKRIVAFWIDLVLTLGPTWVVLFAMGVKAPEAYGIGGGVVLFVYSTIAEVVWRRTPGKLAVGLEVRAVAGHMTVAKAAVRNFPKVFWFVFPLIDTVAGMLVEGDPRQRFSDRILGTTVAQSSLIHVKVHRVEVPH